MLNINYEVLTAVVEQAKHKVAGDLRWTNAIDRAAREISDNPYMHRQGDALLILSSTSNAIYTANGTCQCRAYELHQPCYHRAANRLLLRYDEMSERCETEADKDGRFERAVIFDEAWPTASS